MQANKKSFIAKSARVASNQNISSLDNVSRIWHWVDLKYPNGIKTVFVMAEDPMDAIAYCNGCTDYDFDHIPFNKAGN